MRSAGSAVLLEPNQERKSVLFSTLSIVLSNRAVSARTPTRIQAPVGDSIVRPDQNPILYGRDLFPLILHQLMVRCRERRQQILFCF